MRIEKIDFIHMLNQFRREILQTNHDPRVSSLLFESNITYVLDEISKSFFKTDLLTNRKIGSERQLKLLTNFRLITKEHKDAIERIRDVRNLIAHSVDIFSNPVENQFRSKVNKLPRLWSMKSQYSTEFIKFEAFCVSLILLLHKQYEEAYSKFANKKLYS